jgi:hypothetical protein
MSRTLRIAAMAAALVAGSGAALSAHAADPYFCADYARVAVHQYEVASNHPNRCMSQIHDFARWSPDYQHHYSWCLGVSRDQTWPERNAR